MPLEFVNASGKPWAPSGAAVVAKPKPKSEAPKEFHKGWEVVGHAPGACESARLLSEKAAAEWRAMTDEQRARAVKDGKREPPPWDEAKWRTGAPKARLRAKPFSVPSAADEMAALAVRAGWEDVEVREMAKVDPEAEARRRGAA